MESKLAPNSKHTLLTCRDSSGKVLLEIPFPLDEFGEPVFEYTAETLLDEIAKQTEGYWRERIAKEHSPQERFMRYVRKTLGGE